MLSYEKQRQLIIICILGIILVVIFAVAALFLIWQPRPEKEKVFEVGKVEAVGVEVEDVMKMYSDDIIKKLQSSDVDGILDMVSKDYYEYQNMTRADLKEVIDEANMYGKSISLENAVVYSVPGYNNVFVLDLKSDGEFYSLSIVVRETSPNQYTIAFDKFIDYKDNVYTGNAESITLSVIKRARFTTSVTYRLRVTNNYHDIVTLNSEKSADPVPLVSYSTSQSRTMITSSIANMALEIEEGTAREFEVTYSIINSSDHSTYNVLVLNDVLYNNVDGARDLEFKIK